MQIDRVPVVLPAMHRPNAGFASKFCSMRLV